MAGTIKRQAVYGGRQVGGVEVLELLATADAADGSFPTLDIGKDIEGTILALETNPGSTAPTDNYDITLVDPHGRDILDSVGLNRDTSTTEITPVTGASYIALGEAALLTIVNNSVNSATVVIRIYFTRAAIQSAGILQALSATVDSVSIGASTSGGCDVFNSLDLDETEEDVKTSPGQVFWVYVMNLRTSNLYLRLYNATAANTTVGTTAKKIILPLASNATDDVGHMITFNPPIAFDTAICAAATTGFADNDTGAPGANECIVAIGYK